MTARSDAKQPGGEVGMTSKLPEKNSEMSWLEKDLNQAK
jgi:hypothetical protein